MNEVTLSLASQPNSGKADFLATLEPVPLLSSSKNRVGAILPNNGDDLPFEITLDAYTRDAWSSSEFHRDGVSFCNVWMKSTDGRQRLPGFISYLKERKKSAYSIFTSPRSDPATGKIRPNHAVFIVPYDPPPLPPLDPGITSDPSIEYIFIRYCLDGADALLQTNHTKEDEHEQGDGSRSSHIPNNIVLPQEISLKKNPKEIHKSTTNTTTTTTAIKTQPLAPLAKQPMNGFLGKLVSKQERTQHIISTVSSSTSTLKKNESNPSTTTTTTTTTTDESSSSHSSAQQVIHAFRLEMEEKLLEFVQSSHTNILIPISLAVHTRKLSPSIPNYLYELSNISMDVLKFIVYEQVQDVLGDLYVAVVDSENDHSLFMDELSIRVYKPGCAPQKVLDEVCTGDVPDEVQRQNQVVREARLQEHKKRMRVVEQESIQSKKHCCGEGEMESLDQKKRDRRTMEEIQREIMEKNRMGR